MTFWVILSVVIGIASTATSWQFGLDAIDLGLGGGNFITWWWQWHGVLEHVSLGLSVLWLAVFTAGLVVHGWRGLWLLIGAPLALAQPRALREPQLIIVMLFTGEKPPARLLRLRSDRHTPQDRLAGSNLSPNLSMLQRTTLVSADCPPGGCYRCTWPAKK